MGFDRVAELGLPEEVAEAVSAFGAGLQNAFAERLEALLVYGSAVSGYRAGRSDVNLLIVLDRVGLDDLAAIGALAREARRAALAPVVLATTDLAETARAMPATVRDVRDRHVALIGADPFAESAPSDADLAAHLRFELRDKLYRLRAGCLADGRPARLERLAAGSFGSVLHLLRHVLALRGASPGQHPVQVIGNLARELKLELGVLQALHGACYGGDRLDKARVPVVMDGYLRLLETALAALPEEPAAVEPESASADEAPAADEEGQVDQPAEAEPATGDDPEAAPTEAVADESPE